MAMLRTHLGFLRGQELLTDSKADGGESMLRLPRSPLEHLHDRIRHRGSGLPQNIDKLGTVSGHHHIIPDFEGVHHLGKVLLFGRRR